MYKWEQNCADFIRRHLAVITICLITLIALSVRYYMLSYMSVDFTATLRIWFIQIQENGNLAALRLPIGNYPISYMTIMALLSYLPCNPLYTIKFVSILFDFILAVSAALIVHHLCSRNSKKATMPAILTYAAVLFLPSVMLNSACWGQCDSIYASFLLLFLLYMLKGRYCLAFIFCGLAFSFKLQSVFLLPALLIYYFLSQKFSIKYILLIPVVFILTSLPSIIAGRPFLNIIGIYFHQTKDSVLLSYNYPDIALIFNDPNLLVFKNAFILLTFAVLVIGFAAMLYKNFRPKIIDFVGICFWCAYACVMFLPAMHERYAFVVEVLSVIYVIARRKQWYIAVGVNVIAVLCYIPFLFQFLSPVNMIFLSIVNFLLFVLFSWQSFRSLLGRSADPELPVE